MNVFNTASELLDSVQSKISQIEMSDDDIANAKKKIKEIESAIRDKNKTKTITISHTAHSYVKEYCDKKGINIGEWVSNLLLKEAMDELHVLNINDIIQNEIVKQNEYLENVKNEKENIINKYKNFDTVIIEDLDTAKDNIVDEFEKYENNYNKYFLSNKLIVANDIRFIGYNDECNRAVYGTNDVTFSLIKEASEEHGLIIDEPVDGFKLSGLYYMDFDVVTI